MSQNDRNEGTPRTTTKHAFRCICGVVQFEADIDVEAGASRCNCTICTRVAQTSSIVKPSAFKLVAGEADLTRFGRMPEIASRYFCKHCGTHCFGKGHLEQLGGDFVSVNWNCIEDLDLATVKVGYWDGRHDNWQAGLRDEPWPVQPAGR
jgi:hypothetical protein